MRLDKARPLILVHGEPRCGHCLSRRVEWAEFEAIRYEDSEGEKSVLKPGYLCIDCFQVSQPPEGSPQDTPSSPPLPETSDKPSLSGPLTW
jgi:hypothetical protein